MVITKLWRCLVSNLEQRLGEWAETQAKLKTLKAVEALMRREICTEILAERGMQDGRVTVSENFANFRAKATQSLSYKVDDKALRAIWPELTEFEQAAVVYKPSLAMAVYKKLPYDSLLQDVITTTLAMPTLKVEIYEWLLKYSVKWEIKTNLPFNLVEDWDSSLMYVGSSPTRADHFRGCSSTVEHLFCKHRMGVRLSLAPPFTALYLSGKD